MRRFASILLCIFCAPNVFAWGEEGHRIVCRIAYLHLKPAERAEVNRLTAAYKVPKGADAIANLSEGCVFPDTARIAARAAKKAGQTKSPWLRFGKFDKWHFVNVPRDTRLVTEGMCNKTKGCLFSALKDHAAQLKNGSTDQERAEALFFLGHWVGDIHQPLHVSFEDDTGGNVIPVEVGYYGKWVDDLHAVWDSGIIRRTIGKSGDWGKYARDLKTATSSSQGKKWLASDPVAWAQESYDITTLAEVDYCEWGGAPNGEKCRRESHTRELGQDYQNEFRDDVDLRLQQAGVRLAAVIRKNLF